MAMGTGGATQSDVERLLVERRIEKVLVAYCQGVDRKDWDQVRACYHDDATDSHGEFVGSPDELVAWLTKNHAHVTSSMHMLTNISIRFSDDAPLARVESYVLSFKEVTSARDDVFLADSGGEGRARRSVAARYIDTFEDRPEIGWRIADRAVAFEWVRREPDEFYLPLQPNWNRSQRDRSDLIFAPFPNVGSAS